MGKQQKGRRGEERLCWPRCLCERSCFVLRGQLSSPLFSYILAATFFTPLCELLPDYLCERETCLSWWCICSCFFPGCCCRLARAPGPTRLQGPVDLYQARCTSLDCTPTGCNGRECSGSQELRTGDGVRHGPGKDRWLRSDAVA